MPLTGPWVANLASTNRVLWHSRLCGFSVPHAGCARAFRPCLSSQGVLEVMSEMGQLVQLIAGPCVHPLGGCSDSQGQSYRRLQDESPVSSCNLGGVTGAAFTRPQGCAQETGSDIGSSAGDVLTQLLKSFCEDSGWSGKCLCHVKKQNTVLCHHSD